MTFNSSFSALPLSPQKSTNSLQCLRFVLGNLLGGLPTQLLMQHVALYATELPKTVL